MNTLHNISNIFSTRELSLIIWIAILIILIISINKIRESIIGVLKFLIDIKIGTILFLMMAYISGLLYIFSKLDLLDFSLLKDIIFWFITVALTLLFTINKADNTRFFKNIIKESLKWTIILEFIINFYSFNFWVELFLLPLIFILAFGQALTETNDKYIQVNKLLQNILGFIGLIFISYTTYKTFVNIKEIFTWYSLFTFLLPPIMTICLIPYLYFLALYMNYETLFSHINQFYNNLNDKKIIKREILFCANLNLNRLNSIIKNLNKFELYKSNDIKSYIRKLIHQETDTDN